MRDKTALLMLAVMAIAVATTARAEVNLSVGDSVVIGGTRVTCGYQSEGPGESATSRECGQEDYYGKCIFFNESTITGRHCATADVCGKEDYYGKCIYFNTQAACGDNSCTKSRSCGKKDYYGKCIYFNESVSCR